MNILEDKQRLEARINSLYKRAINGQLAEVSAELNGLSIHNPAGMNFKASIMEAIADKVLDDTWVWQVVQSFGQDPVLTILTKGN